MSDDKRRTGRTTRMLEAARRAAEEGRAVCVVGDSTHHAKILGRDFPGGAVMSRCLGVKFETPESIMLNWETMRVRGMHPNCEVFVDHRAIESRFALMLTALHAYDAKEQP